MRLQHHHAPQNSDPWKLEKPSVRACHVERAQRLHRQFKRMLAREAAGKPIAPRLRFFAWYWSKRCYHCDPQRRVQFSVGTLARLYRQWKRGGCVALALLPKYRPSGPSIPLWVYLRFLNLVSRVDFPTMKAAHAEFCRRGGGFGPGRPPSKLVAPLTYGQLLYYFPGSVFTELKARQRALQAAQNALDEFLVKVDAELRARVPERPKRKRRTGADMSLEASQL